MTKAKAVDTATAIRALYPEGVEIPSVGVSIVANLGGDRQLTVQTFYPVGASADGVNALIDSLMVPVGRQKAIAELIDLEADQVKIAKTLAQFTEDYGRIEGDHAAAQARRKVELEEMQKASEDRIADAERQAAEAMEDATRTRQAEYAGGEEEHRAGKRTGAYTPQGHRKANLERIDAQMRKMDENNKAAVDRLRAEFGQLVADKVAEIAAADADRDQHKSNLEISLKRHTDELARLAGEIDKRKELIG